MNTIYQIGSATLDITPPVGIKLAGFATLKDPSTSVELPLRAVAYSIADNSGTETILVTAELIGFYDKAPEVRARISEATGVPVKNIVLGVTHTHAGPCFRASDERKKGPLDMVYYRRMVETLTQAAVQAKASRKPSHIYARTVEYPFGVNRRSPDGKGGIAWGANPNGAVDHIVSILDIREADSNKLTAVLFSYGCHPTSRATLDIGGDYVGFAYQELDKRAPGVDWGFFQGFAGDVKPAFAADKDGKFTSANSDQIREQGVKWADLIMKTLASDQKVPVEGPLYVNSATIPLRLRRPDRELHQQFLNSELTVSRQWAENNPYVEGAKDPAPMKFEVQVVAMGNSLAIVFLAGEITAGHSKPMREYLGKHYKVVVPVGYSNEMVGYIPAAYQIPEGGYEVYYATQHTDREGFYTEEAEAQIRETAGQLLLQNLNKTLI